MDERTHRIEGVATIANLAAADAIAAQLPNANHNTLFSTGIRLRAVGDETNTCVARFVSIDSRPAAISAAQAILAAGLPPALLAVRIIPRDQYATNVEWLASLGYETIPTPILE